MESERGLTMNVKDKVALRSGHFIEFGDSTCAT